MIEFDDVVRTFRPTGTARSLNVGCGDLIKDAYINLDVASIPGIDVVGSVLQLPFGDAVFDVVECQDVLEHVDVTAALRELHRVLRPGGVLAIQAVHFTSRDFAADPTHVRAFSNRTFGFYCGGDAAHVRGYYFDFAFEAIEFNAIQFHHGRLFWNRPVERMVNRTESTRDVYELTGLSRLFPAANVISVLRR